MSLYKQHRQEIRNYILEVATKLFRDKGYHNVSVEEITLSVGVAKGTFYNLFTSKLDILIEYTNILFSKIEFDNCFDKEKNIEDNVEAFLEKLCEFIRKDEQMHLIFLKEVTPMYGNDILKGKFNFKKILYEIIINSKDYSKVVKKEINSLIEIFSFILYFKLLELANEMKNLVDIKSQIMEEVRYCLYGIF